MPGFESLLPPIESGRSSAERFVRTHLAHLSCDEVAGSTSFRGGQTAADIALAGFDVAGYARRRNEVLPVSRRGASRLSPYIRHGLLGLPAVWRHVAGGPARDVKKFRDELLWQEYARHWYARLGSATRRGIRRELDGRDGPRSFDAGSMACIGAVVSELEADGWLVNQTRMWMASHWSIREGQRWQTGDDWFFAHLLDGSRAANRLGWQWTTGVGSSKPYGFSRWQVNKRAPELCATCEHQHACPIEDWPDDPSWVAVTPSQPDEDAPARTGPDQVESTGTPEAVWLTAESLGHDDPALLANPDLPAVFVFDEPLLASLSLSSKRLVFLAETLAEIGEDRPLELHLGRPVDVLSGRRLAVTWAPVPGFVSRAGAIGPVEVHPWRWLAQPNRGSVSSFSGWRKRVKVQA